MNSTSLPLAMRLMTLGLLAVAIGGSPAAEASGESSFISPIYGGDNRQDLYEITDPVQLRLADSTVALMHPMHLLSDTSETAYATLGLRLTDSDNVCRSERFALQLSAAFCSGALVGPDLVLTAGHCVESMSDCRDTRVVFGFSLRRGAMSTDRTPKSEVYECSEIVARGDEPDFAVIRLNRAVTGHAPLAIARNESLATGTPLTVIGHPSGLPAKVAGGAFVRDASNRFSFLANLDTYHGNSGSPVFNARTGLIEGILIEGEQDYEYDEDKKCNLNKVCKDDECRGETSTRVSFAASSIPALPGERGVAPSTPAAAPAVVVVPSVITRPAPARVPAPRPRVIHRRSLLNRVFGGHR